MIFINTLKDGDHYLEIYLVKSVSKAAFPKTNKTLLTVTFQDKSGVINGKKWNYTADDVEIFKPGNFVQVDFSTSTYNDKLEIAINSARKVEVKKLDDYIPTSPIPMETLKKDLESYLAKIKDKDIKTIVDELYTTYQEKILTYPAASGNHHAFQNGLLYHTVSMLKVADFLIKHYSDVDGDLVLAGAFLHDIGKIKELSGLLPIEYTMEGNLLGHLVIAANLINNVAVKHHLENNEKVIMLEHIVISSHGKYEYGSPVLGETKEAILVNFLDDLDAKMMMFDNNTKDLNPGEFTNRLLNLDNRRLYKKK